MKIRYQVSIEIHHLGEFNSTKERIESAHLLEIIIIKTRLVNFS